MCKSGCHGCPALHRRTGPLAPHDIHSGPLTPCTEGQTPVDARCEPGESVLRAVKPRIGNRCAASGDFYIRISGINRVFFSYCFRQLLRFRSDIHCFDSWRLVRDFSVTAS